MRSATTSLIFVRGELQASAAWAGALALIGLSAVAAAWISMAAVQGARLLAMAFRITLPTFPERE